MDNLASFIALKPGARGTVIPCVRVLRAIDVASRQQNATFTLVMTVSYLSGGVMVTRGNMSTPIGRSTFHQQLDPMWVDVHAFQSDLQQPPDAGTTYTCTVKITINDNAGSVIDASLVDTQVLGLG